MRMEHTILRNSLLKVRPLPCSLTSRPRTFPPTSSFHPSTPSEGVVTNTPDIACGSGREVPNRSRLQSTGTRILHSGPIQLPVRPSFPRCFLVIL